MSESIPFAAVKAASPRFVEAFCRRYLSDGKGNGGWWIAKVPWRADKTPSLGVSYKTGRWQDFARGDHGDLADLLSRVDNCTPAEAAMRLAAMMGLPS